MDKVVRKVLVVFSNIDVTHRQMLAGILHYAREQCVPPWDVQLDLRDIQRRNSAELVSGGFDGIIAAVINPEDRRKYFATGLPTVLFEPTFARMDKVRRPANNVTFFNDHAAEGITAAEYFLARGYRSFAFVGTAVPLAWSEARRHGFIRRLKQEGLVPRVYAPPRGKAATDFTLESPRLERWLRRLPRNTAVFAAHDERAQQIVCAAQEAQVSIPDDIAVLGVDDDELLCTTASPQISSIPVAAEETGWRFAKAMADLLDGRNPEPIVRTCHTRVVTRTSTDAFALPDPVVAKALGYIGKHLAEPLRGPDLAAAANCSLRTLQQKVLKTLGRTLHAELAVLRQAEALRLLRETRLPISEIARRCGYCSVSHLGARLKTATGLSPRALRAQD